MTTQPDLEPAVQIDPIEVLRERLANLEDRVTAVEEWQDDVQQGALTLAQEIKYLVTLDDPLYRKLQAMAHTLEILIAAPMAEEPADG